MALENLKQNLETEKEIIREIIIHNSQLKNLENLYPQEKRHYEKILLVKNLNALHNQLKIINNSTPDILDSISPFRKLETTTFRKDSRSPKKEKKEDEVKDLVKISYAPKEGKGREVTISKKEKEKFLSHLSLGEDTIRRLKKGEKEKIKKQKFKVFKKSGLYARISNKFLKNLSNSLIEKKHFRKLNLDLRKANMPYLLITYLSMSFFSTLLAFILGIIVFTGLLFFSISLESPFIHGASRDLISIFKNSLVIILLPALTFLSFYFYPYAERKSLESRINREVPFVSIHMSAIAGSGIEPTQIFKILVFGEEYPYTKTEIKKIINQVNFYGYDLVTALKNTAGETSSWKLAELFNGMASAISGGSELSDFLDKRSETLLFEYKLEREKYTKSAETFMDIYISIMIAAPMIMTLLLVLISISNISIGLSLNSLTIIIVSIVSLINIMFLVFLHLRQPSY